MEIRAMTVGHHAAAVALWQSSAGVRLSPGDAEPELAAFLARNPDLSLVALEGARLVATVLCGHDGRRGYLYHLAVAPSHRRRGLARTLVGRCLGELARRGIRRAQVSVFDTNVVGKDFWLTLGGQRRDDLAVFSLPLAPAIP